MPFTLPLSTVVSENDYYTIAHDKQLQALVLTYKRRGTSEEYRLVHYTLLEQLEKNRISRVLIDTNEMGIVSPEDQRWLGQQMIPKLALVTPGKFLYAAVVVPDNIFTKMAVDNVEQISMETGYCLNQHFNSIASAKAWLSAQQSQYALS